MLTQTITGPRGWHKTTIDERQSWYYPLSERCLAALDGTIGQLRRQPRAPIELRLADTAAWAYRDELHPALAALESSRGFAIIEGPNLERYSTAELQAIYYLVGQMLGRPVAQNVQGTLLYDVRDTGQDVRYGARFSVTNAATGFHTDNCFGESVVDYVGLQCLQTALSGGENQLVSAYALHNELLAKHADALRTLYQPFHMDRRGGLRPGDAATVQYPILQWDGQQLLSRYLRYWIEVGHEKTAQPLTAAQVHALRTLEDVLADANLQVELTLRPGDLFFVNNRMILHNRSAFQDHPEPERRRHYVRLWLERNSA